MEYLKIKKLNKNSKINPPAKPGDCGYDCFATRDLVLNSHERYNMPLGIALEFPEGWVCQVNGKSGLADKIGIDTIGNIIDAGYRGEIHCQIVNTSTVPVKIRSNQKICQLLFLKCATPEIKFVDKLNETERGDKGFGSTGNI